MRDPSQWSAAELHLHLQHAIDLEFWTIPLYLTALYSIKGLDKIEPENYPHAAKLIQSVAIQEMLHLEIVCNLSNALGHSPKFHCPHYGMKKAIPFIHPSKNKLPPFLYGYTVAPGALNEQTLKLFCVIEFPEEKNAVEWAHLNSYQSIGNLYEALQAALPHLWAGHYVGDENNNKQKETFNNYHNTNGKAHGFSQKITSLDTALKAIDAVIEQGEGANSLYVPTDYRPHDNLASAHDAKLSHYQKFRTLLHHTDRLPEVYQDKKMKTEARSELGRSFDQFLEELRKSFNSAGPNMSAKFWDTMFALQKKITEVWKAGACPQFGA